MLFRHFHIPPLSVRMDEQQPTYQELLAEIYEDNAANQYVVNRFYEQEEMDAYDEHKYDVQKIEDDGEFNKFQGDRNKPEYVVKPEPSSNGLGKASYAYNRDIRTTLVNVDGRFRDTVGVAPPRVSSVTTCAAEQAILSQFGQSSGTQFAILLGRQYKNVASVKVTSLEFENSFYTFTALDPATGIGRENTTFQITVDTYPTPVLVTIPDGNYTVPELISEVVSSTLDSVYTGLGLTGTTGMTGSTGVFYFNMSQNPRTLKLTLQSNKMFSITFPQNKDNFTKNGLGYNLGFYSLIYDAIAKAGTSPTLYQMLPETRPDAVQDQYVYIKINDWYQVQHQYPDQTKLSAFMKVPLTVPKFTVQYDNIQLDTVVKEHFFTQPSNIHKLEISVVDSFGTVLNMQGGSFSMSIAINEVLQSSIYEKMLQI